MVETRHVHIPPHRGGMDLSRPHFIGIGGQGASALAHLLAQSGAPVTGSDRQSSRSTAALETAGVAVHHGHAPGNVTGASVVVWGSGIPDDNAELTAARAAGIPVAHRSDVVAHLMGQAAVSVAVAGTHGKSTTTAMLASATRSLSPSWAGGGALVGGVNGYHGEGGVFIAEADESDRSITRYRPDVLVVLNVDDDHPETFNGYDDVAGVFRQAAAQARHLVVSADDPGARAQAAHARMADGLTVVSFGEADDADVRITSIEDGSGASRVTVREQDGTVTFLPVPVPGRHMAVNAAAAFAAGRLLGVAPAALASGLAAFPGVQRRMEPAGERDGVRVFDSFAHHPAAVRADIAAARSLAQGRVLVVFEPSGWARTLAFGPQFGQALAVADSVILLPVHSAVVTVPRGEETGTIAAEAATRGVRVDEVPDLATAAAQAARQARPGDVVLAMGTGTVAELSEVLLTQLGAPVAV